MTGGDGLKIVQGTSRTSWFEDLIHSHFYPSFSEDESSADVLILQSTSQLREKLDHIIGAGNIVTTSDNCRLLTQLWQSHIPELPGDAGVGVKTVSDPEL